MDTKPQRKDRIRGKGVKLNPVYVTCWLTILYGHLLPELQGWCGSVESGRRMGLFFLDTEKRLGDKTA